MRYVTRQEIKASRNTTFYRAAGDAEKQFRCNTLAIADELRRPGHLHQSHIRHGYRTQTTALGKLVATCAGVDDCGTYFKRSSIGKLTMDGLVHPDIS